MKLPLVDEIRAARSAVAEAQGAAIALARAEVDLAALDARARHGAAEPDAPRRRAELEARIAGLGPAARSVGSAVVELQGLQHAQHEALLDPALVASREEVHALAEAHDALLRAVVPLEQQLGVLRPALATIDRFVARAEAEVAAAGDAAGTAGWLGAVVRHLAGLLAAVGVQDTLPAHPGPTWGEVAAARDGLVGLRAALAARVERAATEAADLAAERDRAEARLRERAG